MKITILTHVAKEGSTEYDEVVPQVAAALKERKHKVSVLGIHGDMNKLRNGLARRKPDLIFNLMETFGEHELGAVGVAGFLELVGVPYTGAGPGECYIQEDKALTKKLLAFDGICYPRYAVFSRDAAMETGGNLKMPLFVKPLRMDASIGIDAKSLVRTTEELLTRVKLIHDKVKDSALAEEYIDGREFYVGVLGNQVGHDTPQAFPPVEMDFSKLEEGKPRIVDSKAKWDEKSKEFQGTTAVMAELSDELRAKLQRVALDAYRAVRVRDYGRVDLRLTDSGEVYVIEVNASCYLVNDGEFATAGAAAGLEYPALINQIADQACKRYGMKKKKKE